MRRAALILGALLWAVAPQAAAARQWDEFQVYDGRLGEPGTFELDQHLTFGRKGRTDDHGAPRNGVSAITELGYTTSRWHEVAVLLPLAREFSGDAFGGGFKLRNTFVIPGAHERPLGGGFDIEIRHQSARFSEADWAVTLRPIIGLRSGRWQLILNPALEMPLGRGSPVFAPATRAVRQVHDRVWLGVEHYADFGRVDRWETVRRQGHQLFATADWRVSGRVAIHAGVGHGLTRSSDRWVGKLILRFDF